MLERLSTGAPQSVRGLVLALAISNLVVFAITTLVDEPTIFFAIALSLIFVFFFVFTVDNILEIVVLLSFLFSIELLYSGFGKLPLFGALLPLVILAMSRTAIQGTSEWKEVVLAKPIWVFIAVALLSMFIGKHLQNSLRFFSLSLLLGFVIFRITHFSCQDLRSIHFISLCFMFFMVLNGLYGIYYHLGTGYRAESFFVDTPTYSGHFFVQAICLCIAAFFTPPYKRMRFFLLISIFVLTIAVFFSVTRGAWLAFLILGVLLLFFSPFPKRVLTLGLLACVALLLATFYFFDTQALTAMLKSRVSTDVENAGQNIGSLALRLMLWHSAWELFLAHPIMGIGFGNFPLENVSTFYYPMLQSLGGGELHAHNIYLQALAEMGIFGFGALILLIAAFFRRASRTYRKMQGHAYRFLFIGYCGATTLWLVMASSEAALYTPVASGLFFFYLGMISGIHKVAAREGVV